MIYKQFKHFHIDSINTKGQISPENGNMLAKEAFNNRAFNSEKISQAFHYMHLYINYAMIQ
jgi:hypothetical protein